MEQTTDQLPESPNRENLQLWVEALEREEYPQIQGDLRQELDTGQTGYCALGVGVLIALEQGVEEVDVSDLPPSLRKLFGFVSVWDFGQFSPKIANFYGVELSPEIIIDGEETDVADANDKGQSFFTIAQALRARYLKDEG
jgi:hypothetical protein